MTNGDKIRKMTDEELTAVLQCPYEGVDTCIFRSAKEKPSCTDCIGLWLESKAEETEQKKRPPVPTKIDMNDFESQLNSFSIRAIVQNMKYLASKQNKIIEYLQSLEPKEGENE